MKNKSLRILFMLALAVSLVFSLGISASAESGNLGGGLSWRIDDNVLYVEGNGSMPNWEDYDDTPWYEYSNKIEKIIVEDGVFYVGANAFAELEEVKTVDIAGSAYLICTEAFYNCENLETVLFREGIEVVGDGAFNECDNIKTIVFPSTLRDIYEDAFNDAEKLETVWYYGNNWNNVTIEDGNGDFIKSVQNKGIKGLDQIIDFNKWYSDEDYHWNESKSEAPYWTSGPKEAHYDNTGDGLCDVCGFGVLDTSKTLTYIDETGSVATVPGNVRYLNGKETVLNAGWYAVGANIDFGNTRLRTNGDVKLILRDGCGMTLNGGIFVSGGSTLTVYSQSINLKNDEDNHMGYIKVTAPDFDCTGIGANSNSAGSGGKAIFYGGNIEAQGGPYSAGIGSSYDSNFTVEIHNGLIKATGGKFGAGIGSGFSYNHSNDCNVTIDGGYVEAYAGEQAAAIGGGLSGNATVNISGNPIIDAHGAINGKVNDTRTGFTAAGGNTWIIIAGAVVILGGIAAIVISKKKKKPALSEGEVTVTENTEKTEE